MCSASLLKDFEKTTEVLPFNKYGLSSMEEFQKAEQDIQYQELLRKADLTTEEIKLYQEHEAGLLEQRKNIEPGVLKNKLEEIYNKIKKLENDTKSSDSDPPATAELLENVIENQENPTVYPEGHPMNELRELENNMLGRIKTDIIPITKRRKMLRRLERRSERLLTQEEQPDIGNSPSTSKVERSESLWDVQEMSPTLNNSTVTNDNNGEFIGPTNRAMYVMKDNRIVKIERLKEQIRQYHAVDIVMPINAAEAELLEGTKMGLDDIKKIDRFKDYEPGIPSKVLYLKNIAPTVSQEQLSLLFNQFILANGGPVELKIMTGRMRGQAFVSFQNEDLAIQALDEVNGTILGGQPVIAEFGRNTNRIQDNDR